MECWTPDAGTISVKSTQPPITPLLVPVGFLLSFAA